MKPENFVLIETVWGDQDIAIQIERTEEFLTTAREVSDFIKGLPLTVAQNDQLVKLIVSHVQAAEISAFRHGISFGFECGHWEGSQANDKQESRG